MQRRDLLGLLGAAAAHTTLWALGCGAAPPAPRRPPQVSGEVRTWLHEAVSRLAVRYPFVHALAVSRRRTTAARDVIGAGVAQLRSDGAVLTVRDHDGTWREYATAELTRDGLAAAARALDAPRQARDLDFGRPPATPDEPPRLDHDDLQQRLDRLLRTSPALAPRIVYAAALIDIDDAITWSVSPGRDLEQRLVRIRNTAVRAAWSDTRPAVRHAERAWSGWLDDQPLTADDLDAVSEAALEMITPDELPGDERTVVLDPSVVAVILDAIARGLFTATAARRPEVARRFATAPAGTATGAAPRPAGDADTHAAAAPRPAGGADTATGAAPRPADADTATAPRHAPVTATGAAPRPADPDTATAPRHAPVTTTGAAPRPADADTATAPRPVAHADADTATAPRPVAHADADTATAPRPAAHADTTTGTAPRPVTGTGDAPGPIAYADAATGAAPRARPFASPLITLIDDPTAAGAFGGFTFDDEGEPAAPITLVDAGHIVDRLTDRAAGRPGRGRRPGHLGVVAPAPSHLRLTPGTTPVQQLYSDGFLLEGGLGASLSPGGDRIRVLSARARELKAGKPTGRLFADVELVASLSALLAAIDAIADTPVSFAPQSAPTRDPFWSSISTPALRTRALLRAARRWR